MKRRKRSFPILLKRTDTCRENAERIVRDNQENVYRLILTVIRNEEDALDLAQDTFVKAYTSIASFSGASSVSTWLYRIAYNTALDFCKKKGRTPEMHSLCDEDDPETKYLNSSDEFLPEKSLERKLTS